MKKFIVGITGASGFIYGKRLVEELAKENYVYLVVSESAFIVMEKEEGITKSEFIKKLQEMLKFLIIKILQHQYQAALNL
jgi:3-polyprenyl-4-hydroxybenzoate decarboxylase